MGLATASAAASKGAVVTIASSNRERLNAALATLPDTCDGFAVDLRNEADVAALFSNVRELDHLVVTAGDTTARRMLTETALGEARQLFEVRFWGAVAAVRHAVPRFRVRGS